MKTLHKLFLYGSLVTASLGLLNGCSLIGNYWHGFEVQSIEHNMSNLKSIALVPVDIVEGSMQSNQHQEQWTSKLQKALLHVDGLQMVQLVSGTDKSMMSSSQNTMNQSSGMQIPNGSQGILRFKVLDFDPYYPPTAHVQVELYLPGGVQKKKENKLLQLDRQGMGVSSSQHDASPSQWIRFQKVYKADDPKVAYAIQSYSLSQGDKDRGLSTTDRIVKVSDRYIEFVLYQSLRDAFAQFSKSKRAN